MPVMMLLCSELLITLMWLLALHLKAQLLSCGLNSLLSLLT